MCATNYALWLPDLSALQRVQVNKQKLAQGLDKLRGMWEQLGENYEQVRNSSPIALLTAPTVKGFDLGETDFSESRILDVMAKINTVQSAIVRGCPCCDCHPDF